MALEQESYMFEQYRQPLITWEAFLLRMLQHLALASVMMALSLGIGVIGYRMLGELSWVDALLNASMILGGMGPVDILPNDSAKIFASFYALFAGMIFLVAASVLIAPAAHRVLHRLHLDSG
jgi:hypothetical protein